MRTSVTSLTSTFKGLSAGTHETLDWCCLPPQHYNNTDTSLNIPNIKPNDNKKLPLGIDSFLHISHPVTKEDPILRIQAKVSQSFYKSNPTNAKLSPPKESYQHSGLMYRYNKRGSFASLSIGYTEGQCVVISTISRPVYKKGGRTPMTWNSDISYTNDCLTIRNIPKPSTQQSGFTKNTSNDGHTFTATAHKARDGTISDNIKSSVTSNEDDGFGLLPPPPPPSNTKPNVMNIASCSLRLSFDVTKNEITFEIKEDDETVWNVVRRVTLLDCDIDEIVANEGGGEQATTEKSTSSNPSSTPLTNLQPTLFKVRKTSSGGYILNHPALSVGNASSGGALGGKAGDINGVSAKAEGESYNPIRVIACGLFAGTTFSGSSIDASFTDFKIDETSGDVWEKVGGNDYTVKEVFKQRLDLESLD